MESKKLIRILGIARNSAGKVAEILDVREIHSGGSKLVGSYWTGRAFKNDRDADIEQRRLCKTIRRDSDGHPDAWNMDISKLVSI